MSSVPVWIWYLIGAALAVALLTWLVAAINAAINYPKHRREYEALEKRFNEHRKEFDENWKRGARARRDW